jgi:ribosomal protein S18 acetylase RimI-like enzyme
MKYNIRKAKLEDAKGITKVHITSWRETYRGIVDDEYLKSLSIETRTKKWETILKTPKDDKWTFVAEDESGKIVGFISGGLAQEYFAKFTGELYAIYILKKDQGEKLGYRLTKKLCSMLQKLEINTMYVCVLADNQSKNFYTKYGAKRFKSKPVNIGKQMLQEEYYGWKNFENFLK